MEIEPMVLLRTTDFRGRSVVMTLLLGTVSLAMACSSGEDPAASAMESELIADAQSMTQLPDGRWNVVCKDGTTEIVTSTQILANEVCTGGANVPVTCVSRATARWNDGSVRTYAADFCGKNPICTAKATERWNDGSVKSYGEDYCVSGGSATCVKRAESRWSDGSVKSYAEDYCATPSAVCIPKGEGPDYCGASPSCAENCIARWSDGSCRTLGDLFCKESGTPAQCVSQCTARWSDGSCRTFGPDTCS
jgi:hypothetical protein